MSFLQKINLIKCISEIHFLSKFPFISENFFWNLNYLFIYLLCYVTIKTVILQLGSMLVNTGSDRTNVITWHLLDVVFNLSSLELISLKLTERNWSDIFIRLFYRFYIKTIAVKLKQKTEGKMTTILRWCFGLTHINFQVSYARDLRYSVVFTTMDASVTAWQMHSSASCCFWLIILSRKSNKRDGIRGGYRN